MGIFSFGGKRGNARDTAQRESQAGAEPTRERSRRRSVGQETMLDPTLPEKQRARRRLVGAIALALAAVVILPMVLDSHPKPAGDDIAISIPQRKAEPAARQHDVDPAILTGAMAPDNPPGDSRGGMAAPEAAAPTRPAAPTANSRQTAARAAAAATPAPARPAPSPAPTQPAQPAPSTAPSTASRAASGSSFIVQLGTFQNAAQAQQWERKLRALGVPAYVENAAGQALLRAGPFDSRDSARAAVAKVRGAGLGPAH